MVSVIVPIYNVEAYISACLLSISKQTYKELEVILVDDCGTDRSMAIAEAFCKDYQGPIQFRIVKHTHNRGLSAARNTGIDAAEGEYISFLDSDDYIDSHFFEYLLRESEGSLMVVSAPMAEKDKEIYVYNQTWVYDCLKEIAPSDYASYFLLEKVCHTAWGKIARRELYAHIRFREGKNNEDSLFNLDAIPYIESQTLPIRVIPECLYYYRQRNNSICFASDDKINIQTVSNLEEIVEKCRVVHPELVGDLEKKRIRTIYGGIFHSLETTHHMQSYLWKCKQLGKYSFRQIDEIGLPNLSHYCRIFRYFPIAYWVYYRTRTSIVL